MNKRHFFAVGFSLGLAACTSEHLNTVAVDAGHRYYAQTVAVTTSKEFVAGLTPMSGGTPDELAESFANDVQAGLTNDLKGLMRGPAPARVTIEFITIETSAQSFSAPTIATTADLKIIDARSGTTVADIYVQADNSLMRDSTNRDPLAALAGTMLLKAAVNTRNLALWNLAKVFRRNVGARLGKKHIPGLT